MVKVALTVLQIEPVLLCQQLSYLPANEHNLLSVECLTDFWEAISKHFDISYAYVEAGIDELLAELWPLKHDLLKLVIGWVVYWLGQCLLLLLVFPLLFAFVAI